VPPSALGWSFRWNPLGSDVRELTPGSAALPRRLVGCTVGIAIRAGGRNGGFSSILLKVREQLGIVTEAGSPTCLLCQTERPLSWRSRPEGARLVGPAGTKGRPVRRHCPGGPTSRRPQRGSGLPRPGSFAFGRYRNGRRSSRRAQCWRWWDCVRKETPLALRARGMSSSMRRLCPGCSRGMPLI
jgi:hypothetical protein